MTTTMRSLRIPRDHNGPDGIAQGGMLAGRLAVLAGLDADTFEVTLHSPGPLETDLHIEITDDVVPLASEQTVVATVRASTRPVTAPPSVSLEDARAVSGQLSMANPFPRCIVCGRERADGLGVRPGTLPDASRVAAVLPPFALVSQRCRR